jgi:hypothetical protein
MREGFTGPLPISSHCACRVRRGGEGGLGARACEVPRVKYVKALLCAALFLALFAPVVFYHALTAGVMLDDNDALRRMAVSPLDYAGEHNRLYSLDHPAIYRWVGRAVLSITGTPIGEIPTPDGEHDFQWNTENRHAPWAPVLVLRKTTATAYVLALLALFFAARVALGSYVWGFFLGAWLAIPERLGWFVAGYIMTDAYLALFIAVSLLVWLVFNRSRNPLAPWRVAVMGVVIGLAVSSKVNGALVLLAYMSYLAIRARGARCVLLPLEAAAAAFAVFVAINPIMLFNTPVGWLSVIHDMVGRREEVLSIHKYNFGEFGIWQRLGYLFPLYYLFPLPVFLIAIIKASRQPWFLPVALWAAFLIAGTAATLTQGFYRYVMPVDFAVATIVTLSAASVIQRLRRREITIKDLLH